MTMQFVSYLRDGQAGFGLMSGNGQGIIELGARLADCATLRLAIETDRLDALAEKYGAHAADLDAASVTLLPPVPQPDKILCVGVNYGERNAEYKDNSDAPKYPSLFLRTPGTVVGHRVPLVKPAVSEQFDYEGEIVLVIGKEGRHIPEARALEHVAGLSIANEGSVRDWLRHGKFNVTQGKNFERSGSIGPWMTRVGSPHELQGLTVSTRVNGELRQQDTTDNMMFPFARLIHYISTFARLLPGDLILTGTPTGAGARFDPPRYLKAGDVVRVEVSGVGALENEVVDEAAPTAAR
jgi:2-keto-4-pentenoate hydratase/2-oxohepta-3-ene-1,7-dioic acid hydratase in catechol pathway